MTLPFDITWADICRKLCVLMGFDENAPLPSEPTMLQWLTQTYGEARVQRVMWLWAEFVGEVGSVAYAGALHREALAIAIVAEAVFASGSEVRA